MPLPTTPNQPNSTSRWIETRFERDCSHATVGAYRCSLRLVYLSRLCLCVSPVFLCVLVSLCVCVCLCCSASSNNWVLIKVVKLLGSLVPLEPRLAKKLTEPLSDIITTTPAKSLLYECVNTLLCGELRSKTVVKLCLEKLRNFIEDADQNRKAHRRGCERGGEGRECVNRGSHCRCVLSVFPCRHPCVVSLVSPLRSVKYLGLLGLHKLLQKQPRVVAEHKDLILDCLNDEDITIRMRALDLITSMVSLKNLTPIVAKLRQHLDAAEGVGGNYREHVLERILFICAQDSFAYISDFEWYIGILVDLTHLQGISLENARSINTQLLEVVIRVPGVRSYVMKQMINILLANRLASAATAAATKAAVTNGAESATPASTSAVAGPASATQGHMAEVLYAVGFIIGEYTEYLSEESEGGAGFFVDLLNNLSRPEVTHLPAPVQNVFVNTMIKVLSAALLQPFDNAAVKDNLSTAKKKATTRATNLLDDAASATAEGEGDEMAEEPAAAPAPALEEDLLGEEEEEDNDSYGLRKRKHPSLKRTYVQWHSWVGKLLNILHTNLPAFTRADSVEVQERAVAYLQLVKWIIVQGEWESHIERWSGASKSPQPGSNSSSSKEEKKEEKSDDKSTSSSSGSIAAPAPVRELNLLGSLDPLGDSSLSIFDAAIAPKAAATGPASAAAPVEPLFASMSLSPSSGNGGANPALKDKLRNLAIQLGLLYAERLNPVNPKAQRKVAVPKGLDLDVEINAGSAAPPPDTEAEGDRSDEDEDPYSTKPRRSKPKPKGGLYDDDFSVGSGGFGARPSRKKAAGSRGDYAGASSASSGFLDSLNADKNLTPAEKEEAKRRAERRKAAQMNDPYYLKDNKDIAAANTPSQALLNVDHIPVRRLDDDDLPQIKVTSSSRKSGELDDAPAAKNKKTFKVLRTDEMPENDELSSDEDAKDKKRSKHGKDRKRDKKSSSKGGKDSGSDADALDMDLTTPLKPDEFIPRVKTYAESQAAAAPAAAEDKSSHRSKRDKDDKERDGKKDKKHRSDRDRDRERDRDRDRKSDRKDSDAPKSSAAAPASVNLFDLFDPMGAGAPAPAAAAAASSSSSSSRDHRKSTTSSSSSSSAAAPSPSSASSSVDRSLRDCSLYKDSSLRLRSWATWQSGSQVLVTIEATLAADNPKKIAALPKVLVEIKPGKHAKSLSAAPGASASAAKVNEKGVLSLTLRDVTPLSSVSAQFLIDFSSALDRDFTFAGRVSYTADKSDKGKEGESAELTIPVSTFIAAKKLSASEMAQALMNSKPAPTCLAQAQLTLKRTKVSDAIRNVTGILNVALVEAVSFTATYFGVMVANQTAVAVLVKVRCRTAHGGDGQRGALERARRGRVCVCVVADVRVCSFPVCARCRRRRATSLPCRWRSRPRAARSARRCWRRCREKSNKNNTDRRGENRTEERGMRNGRQRQFPCSPRLHESTTSSACRAVLLLIAQSQFISTSMDFNL